jgi:hypothetical protein
MKFAMINFWKKQSGNFMNHKDGLSVEQVEFLHSLQPGDRIIFYVNEEHQKHSENSPDGTLKSLGSAKALAAANANASAKVQTE